MVDLETLATLDSLIWLQTGEEVGQHFQFNQSSVSRNQRKCAQAEWHVLGDLSPGSIKSQAEFRP